MKREFLRRLSALALAVALAASLCAVPALAAGPTPDVSTQLIVLENRNDEKTLTVTGLAPGDKVTWNTTGAVTLSVTGEVEIPVGGSETSVDVDLSGTGEAKGTVTAHVTRAESAQGAGDGLNIDLDACYVYSRNTFPISVNPPVENMSVTVGGSTTVTATISGDTIGGVPVSAEDLADIVGWVSFTNGGSTRTSLKQDTGSNTVEITGNSRGTDIITMVSSETGEVLGEWSLTITRAPTGVPVTEIYMKEPGSSAVTMALRDTMELMAAVLPTNATDKAVSWSSSNPAVVSVDKVVAGKSDGIDVSVATITAKAVGTATITATPDNADPGIVPASVTVTVRESASSLDLELANPLINVDTADTTREITAKLFGENHDQVSITWTTNNPNVVAFDANGLRTITTDRVDPLTENGVAGSQAKVTVYGRKANNSPVTITAVATFGTDRTAKKITKTITVTVIDSNTVLVNSVRVNESTHSMPADGTFTLTATVSPSNAPVKTVTWSSGNTAVATVDEKTGKVTGVAAGQTTITATAYGGANARCLLTVTPKAETIQLSGGFSSTNPVENKYSYVFGSTGNDVFTVRAALTPTGANDPIHWTSDKESVATVGGEGNQAVIRAVAPGTAKITAVPMDPANKDRVGVTPAEITITVSGLTLDLTSLTLAQGRRQELVATAWGSTYNGDHSCEWISSDPSVVTVSSASGASTTLNARAPGAALITARKGAYSATCSVTVTEDTAGVIEGISTRPGAACQFSSLVSSIQSACSQKTGAGLSYITNLSVASTDQGILHDDHYSADDTGAGVGIQDRYYPGTPPQGGRSMSDLSFVPRTSFSGTAEINYTAWSTNNQSVSGVIRITVNGTGDVMYSGNAGSAINFLASDFSRIHSNLRSVSFTPPQADTGVLYYKYITAGQPGTRVTASDVYNRTGSPSIDDVSFVPAAGYRGTVRISYKGTDTAGRSISGVVTITVTNSTGTSGSADISYTVQENSWVTFRSGDFNTASRRALGEALSYVRFTQPPSGEGTLFYNYRGFSDFDGTALSTTSYYYNGAPALSGVSFVATTTTPSRVDIPYTGYTTQGHTFNGTVHITRGGAGSSGGTVEQDGLRYTVFTGRSVNFNAGDFNTLCQTKLGRNLVSIQFNGLPGTSQGNLRLTRGNSSTPSDVTTGTRFFRTGSSTSNLIGNVYFQAAANYTGTFTIPFTGTDDSGATFTDSVTIVVTLPVSNEVTYSGTTANPILISSAHIASAASGALNGTLSYITFNNLPDTTAGRLYLNYGGFGTGTPAASGTRYYASGAPGIDQICFVPRGRCTGQVGVGYTAVSTSGQTVSGRIMFNITSTGNSNFFTDMSYHTWAAPAVDYLYQNGVVQGVTATTYGPSSNIRRRDFVLMLSRAFRLSGSNGYSFADVPVNSYYSQAVATAKQLGIISGDGVNFHPNSALTRQDAMVMIYNALNASGRTIAPASTSVLDQFSDGGAVSVYARNAVSTLVHLGAVNGSTSGRLNPGNPITRAEAAIILHFIMTM